MRKVAINLRATPLQCDLIDQATHLTDKSRSDFILQAACDKAQSALLDQVFFSVPDSKFHQFTMMLDTPMQPNLGLERLLAVKAPWTCALQQPVEADSATVQSCTAALQLTTPQFAPTGQRY